MKTVYLPADCIAWLGENAKTKSAAHLKVVKHVLLIKVPSSLPCTGEKKGRSEANDRQTQSGCGQEKQ
jgi:hypothetical protein